MTSDRPASPTDLVGKTGEPFRMTVELGKARELAKATRSTTGPDLGDDGAALAPPTFLVTAGFWQQPAANPLRGAGIELARVLHGEQQFVFHGRPLAVGDVLDGLSRIDQVYEKAGRRGGSMTFYEVLTEFRCDGELVAESRSTLIETAAKERTSA
jgi:hydroxyacyl-ACP dehydratase HTD2-like protein with hotdog domain